MVASTSCLIWNQLLSSRREDQSDSHEARKSRVIHGPLLTFTRGKDVARHPVFLKLNAIYDVSKQRVFLGFVHVVGNNGCRYFVAFRRNQKWRTMEERFFYFFLPDGWGLQHRLKRRKYQQKDEAKGNNSPWSHIFRGGRSILIFARTFGGGGLIE